LVTALNTWCTAAGTTAAKDNLKLCAPSTWNVKVVGDISKLFDQAANPGGSVGTTCDLEKWGELDLVNAAGVSYDDMNSWDVSGVTNMKALLYTAAKQALKFNLPLNGWNVAAVTDMSEMFYGAKVFDQDLNAWDVGSATKLTSMFRGTSAADFNVYNQSLNSWNVAKVTDMEGVFADTKYFSKEIGSWNTAKVITMKDMFKGATAFAQNLNDWDVGKVATMKQMFMGATMFNAPVNAWNVSLVTDVESMFSGTSLFNQDLSAWDVGSQNFANVPGVEADYGMLSGPITDMFVSTAMSDCNKKTIHNKMDKDITTRSLKDFDLSTEDPITVKQDWSYPNLVCP